MWEEKLLSTDSAGVDQSVELKGSPFDRVKSASIELKPHTTIAHNGPFSPISLKLRSRITTAKNYLNLGFGMLCIFILAIPTD